MTLRSPLSRQVRGVLNRVLTQVERGAERDARSAEREVAALLSVMVRQVESHVTHDLPLGGTICVPIRGVVGDDARKVARRPRPVPSSLPPCPSRLHPCASF